MQSRQLCKPELCSYTIFAAYCLSLEEDVWRRTVGHHHLCPGWRGGGSCWLSWVQDGGEQSCQWGPGSQLHLVHDTLLKLFFNINTKNRKHEMFIKHFVNLPNSFKQCVILWNRIYWFKGFMPIILNKWKQQWNLSWWSSKPRHWGWHQQCIRGLISFSSLPSCEVCSKSGPCPWAASHGHWWELPVSWGIPACHCHQWCGEHSPVMWK